MVALSLKASMRGGGVEVGEVVQLSNALPSLFTTGSGETYLKAGYIIQNDAANYPAAFADYSFNYFKQTLKSTNTAASISPMVVTAGNGTFMRISATAYSIDISYDFGATWVTKNPSSTNNQIYDIAYGNGVWIVLHNATAQVCRSTDNGVTWTNIATPSTSRGMMTIDYDYTNNMFVFMAGSSSASTNYWLYTSVDSGATWTQTTAILSVSSLVRSLKYVGSNTFILVTSTGIFRSVSATATKIWTRVDGAASNYLIPNYTTTSAKPAFDGSRIVVVCTYNPSGTGSTGALPYFLVSYDLGATFVPVDPTTLVNFAGNGNVMVWSLGNCLVTSVYGQYTEDGTHMYGLFGSNSYTSVFYDRVANKYYFMTGSWNSTSSAFTTLTYEVAIGIPTIGLPIDSDTHINSNSYMRIK